MTLFKLSQGFNTKKNFFASKGRAQGGEYFSKSDNIKFLSICFLWNMNATLPCKEHVEELFSYLTRSTDRLDTGHSFTYI